MSTEKDREAAESYAEGHKCHMQMTCHIDFFLAGIQHARQEQKPLLIKFITWVRNHYAVNAVATNNDLVEYFIGEE